MKDTILLYISDNSWDAAKAALDSYLTQHSLDDTYAILGATIAEHFGDCSQQFFYIQQGLLANPKNYELYFMLGNYYYDKPNLANICFSQAEFYAKNSANCQTDYETILEHHAFYQQQTGILKKKVSIVIGGHNSLEHLMLCLNSIRITCDSELYELIVVDNGFKEDDLKRISNQKDVLLITNETASSIESFYNQAVSLSDPENDVLFLHSDTILPDNALFTLMLGLYQADSIGCVSAMTNAGADEQLIHMDFDKPSKYMDYASTINIPGENCFEERTWLSGFALLVRRTALQAIGGWDEAFPTARYSDCDFCARIRLAGYENLLCHNSFLLHWDLDVSNPSETIQFHKDSYDHFKKKWNMDPEYYTNIRHDLLRYISHDKSYPIRVLELGCGSGSTLSHIKYLYPNASVYGIEIMENVTKLAGKSLELLTANVEDIELPYPNQHFDYIICGDVLEHLRDPEAILKKISPHIKNGGHLLVSLPNIMNASVIHDLLQGNFTYKDCGILDRTHLKFFTKAEIQRMFHRLNLNIEHLNYTYLSGHAVEDYPELFDSLLSIPGVAPKEDFDAFQYLICATKQ